jgi:hypothetical protein
MTAFLITRIKAIALYQIPKYDRAALYWQAGTIVAGMVMLWLLWPWVPTLAIGFLGVVAAIMAIRADSLTPPEKIVWIIIAFALFGIETRSVLKDREEFAARQSALRIKEDEARTEEHKAFADVLKESQKLLGRADTIQTLTARNLEQVTGGNSYAVVQPSLTQRPDRDIPLLIENHGSDILTGVTVAIYDTGVWIWGTHDSIMRSVENRISVGTLYPKERLVLNRQIKPEQFMQIAPGMEPPNTELVYRVFLYIGAQNFTATEYLDFKKDAQGKWNYMYRIYRPFLGTRKIHKNGYVEPDSLLEKIDWSEDMNNPSKLVKYH